MMGIMLGTGAQDFCCHGSQYLGIEEYRAKRDIFWNVEQSLRTFLVRLSIVEIIDNK